MKFRILFLGILMMFELQIFAQNLCNGSLGENIFTDGDFGTGTSSIVLVNPMIAPGYMYSQTIPFDGFYSVVKTTSIWSNLFDSWLRIKDNSLNHDGYMMVVNASYNPGIFYEKVIDGLCGNTTYQFSADIINLIRTNTLDHLDPNVAFLLDDVVMYTTGKIDKNEKWNTYGFTFTTLPGQTTIKLTLRNNAPGGIGNDLALDNISFRPCGPSAFIGLSSAQTVYLCYDDDPLKIQASVDNTLDNYYIWQTSSDGVNWTELKKNKDDFYIHTDFTPNDYYYRYLSAGDEVSIDNAKCRVISDVIHISVLPLTYQLKDTFCQGNVYHFGKQNISNPGDYNETFTSSYGCDSVVYLELHLVNDPSIQAQVMLLDPSCFGYEDGEITVTNINGGYGGYELFYNGDEIYDQHIGDLKSGTYRLIIRDHFGCRDSFLVDLIDPLKFLLEPIDNYAINLGDNINIKLQGNYALQQIQWTPSIYFDCDTCQTVTCLPAKTVNIETTASNSEGCTDTIQIAVIVSKKQTYILPNIISPLSQNENSKFTISTYKSAVSNIVMIEIFDRYGNVVYKDQNRVVDDHPFVLWDGLFEGHVCESGVYPYIIKILLLDGTIESITGDLTIIK